MGACQAAAWMMQRIMEGGPLQCVPSVPSPLAHGQPLPAGKSLRDLVFGSPVALGWWPWAGSLALGTGMNPGAWESPVLLLSLFSCTSKGDRFHAELSGCLTVALSCSWALCSPSAAGCVPTTSQALGMSTCPPLP